MNTPEWIVLVIFLLKYIQTGLIIPYHDVGRASQAKLYGKRLAKTKVSKVKGPKHYLGSPSDDVNVSVTLISSNSCR